ncbi:hypothetical protein [Nocardioides sp. TF02-7]|uniref:hypothetical protein n=1 Tax=Nocardioides sp. TF02-7 TaxID=2917724 RepID=UPI001F070880|nr:hypothetical protein [Nocardioides sp. TF02-7]UMG94252.1 hypothetical protein MF408_09665 [Nocardioides sp. TF02-7]
MLVADLVRLLEDGGALGAGVLDAAVDVGHLERDVDDAVAVPGVVPDERALRAHRALDHEPGRPADQHERLMVGVAGLGAGVGHQLHAVGGAEVVGGLDGVADDPDEGVPAGDGERVAAGVVLHQPDQLAELVEVEPGELLGVGQGGGELGHGAS